MSRPDARARPRRSLLPLAAILSVAALGGAPRQARAAVAPAFAAKVSLDSAYVTGATKATDIAFSADGRAIVTTQTGTLYVRHGDGSVAPVAYPFPPTLDTTDEKGVMGVVADPNVATNRAFYFYVSNGPTNDKHRVYRAVLGAATDTFTVDATPVIAASRGLGPGLEGPSEHNGGALSINGGMLYVGVGDTGWQQTPPVNKYGSCLDRGSGKILRVNLDGTIPASNPLVGLTSVTGCDGETGSWTTAAPDTRIFVWGQRNPFRLWVDPKTSRVWVGDVGEDTSEEIAIYAGGEHGGYPFVEGSVTWGPVDGQTCATETPSRACTAPAFSYGHTVGQAVIGGLVVDGCGWNKVFGGTTYVFGDWGQSWIRGLSVATNRLGLASSTAVDFATGAGPVAFRMGPDQSLYSVQNNTGVVYRFTPLDQTGSDCLVAAVPSGTSGSTTLLALLLAGIGLVGLRATRGRCRTPGSR